MTGRKTRQIFAVLGLLLFAYLLKRTGWGALAHDFRQLGWFLLLILALSGIKYVISAWALSAAFFPEERQSWRHLFGYRLAGEAMNYLSVAGPLASEPVKAYMVRGVGFAPALASSILETTVNAIAAGWVSVAGLLALIMWHAPAATVRHAGYATILVLLAFGFGFFYALKHRVPFLTGPWRRMRRIRSLSSPRLGEKLALIEGRMHRLNAERTSALWWMLLLSLLNQGLALLEIYAALIPLGIKPGFASVLAVEAFTKLAKALFFFVPARIGADEGSSLGVFALLGFSPAAGVTLALARRLRAVFWSAVGIAFLLAHGVKSESRRPERGRWPSLQGERI
ncbi:MAG: flippase-like domain-containing protein [Acidobacteria bacterium]|nr:flippase-like domain-containing protein [Acidobacteriota bacterium]